VSFSQKRKKQTNKQNKRNVNIYFFSIKMKKMIIILLFEIYLF